MQLDKIAQETAQATNEQKKYNNTVRDGESAVNGLWGKVKGLVATYATFQSGKKLITASDDYADTMSRIKLMNDGLQTTAELEQKIRNVADQTYSSFALTSSVVGKLGVNANEAFEDSAEVVDFVEQLNKHLVIAGTRAETAEGALTQLTQAMANGVLRGEELASVMDGMPTVVQAVEDFFAKRGVTTPIRKIGEAGLITSDILKAALWEAAEETDRKFNEMGTTFRRLWTLFRNKANEAFRPVFQKLNKISSSETAKKIAVGLGTAIGTIGKGLMYVMDLVGKTFNFIRDNIQFIAPIIGVISAAFVALGASILFAKLQAIWHAVASAVQTAAIVALEFATHGASAGFAALAAAMSINPVMLFVYAVIALIGVFYLAIAVVNKFCGTSLSATGIIAAAFTFLGLVIYNMIANAWNNFATFAEFLVNLFKHPVYSIKSLFINLATNFIDSTIAMTKGWDKFATSIANAFTTAINWVIEKWNAFVDILPDKVKSALGLGKGSKLEYSTSITSDLTNAKSALQSLLGEKPDDYWTAPRMGFADVGKNTLNAYDWGKGLGESISEKLDLDNLLSDVGMSTEELLKNAKDLAKSVDDASGSSHPRSDSDSAKRAEDLADKARQIANNTAKMAKNYDEEIKFMRELGQREAINRFTTAQIKIMQNNSNHISKDVDANAVQKLLTEGLRETLNVAAERG